MSERDLFELWLADKGEIKVNIRSFSTHFVNSVLDSRVEGFTPEMISRNEHGKPLLTGSLFSFSLSHCGNDYALLLCRQEKCGVDLQKCEDRAKFDEAFRSVFTDGEYELLNRQGSDKDFFQLWSVKEAFIKAEGGSIWYGRDYDFSLQPGDYSDRWIQRQDMYIYSTEIIPGKFLSTVVPQKPHSIDFRKFA